MEVMATATIHAEPTEQNLTVSPVLSAAPIPAAAAVPGVDYVPLTNRPTLASFVVGQTGTNENALQRLHSFLDQLGRKSDGRDWVLPTRKSKTSSKRKSSKRSKKDRKKSVGDGANADDANADIAFRSKSFCVSSLSELREVEGMAAGRAQEAPDASGSKKKKKKSSKRKHKDEKKSSKKKKGSSSSSKRSRRASVCETKDNAANAAAAAAAQQHEVQRRASICGPPPSFAARQQQQLQPQQPQPIMPQEAPAYIPMRQSFDATNLRMHMGMVPHQQPQQQQLRHSSPMAWTTLHHQPQQQQVRAQPVSQLGYIGDHSSTTLANLAPQSPPQPTFVAPLPRHMPLFAQPVDIHARSYSMPNIAFTAAMVEPEPELAALDQDSECQLALGVWNDWETSCTVTEDLCADVEATLRGLDSGIEVEGDDASRRSSSSLEQFAEQERQSKLQQQLLQQKLQEELLGGLTTNNISAPACVPADPALDQEYSKLFDAFCGDEAFAAPSALSGLSSSMPGCGEDLLQDELFRSVSFCL